MEHRSDLPKVTEQKLAELGFELRQSSSKVSSSNSFSMLFPVPWMLSPPVSILFV